MFALNRHTDYYTRRLYLITQHSTESASRLGDSETHTTDVLLQLRLVLYRSHGRSNARASARALGFVPGAFNGEWRRRRSAGEAPGSTPGDEEARGRTRRACVRVRARMDACRLQFARAARSRGGS
jgi:hypothetical protein